MGFEQFVGNSMANWVPLGCSRKLGTVEVHRHTIVDRFDGVTQNVKQGPAVHSLEDKDSSFVTVLGFALAKTG